MRGVPFQGLAPQQLSFEADDYVPASPNADDAAALEDVTDAVQQDVCEHFGCDMLIVRDERDFHGQQDVWSEQLKAAFELHDA